MGREKQKELNCTTVMRKKKNLSPLLPTKMKKPKASAQVLPNSGFLEAAECLAKLEVDE